MNTTLLGQLLASIRDQNSVLYGVGVGESASVYTVRQGVIYMHRLTTSGHGYMSPQVSDRAAWLRVAAVCAWTVPANPQTMRQGLAGHRLGQFWAALPDTAAERATSTAELVQVATQQ